MELQQEQSKEEIACARYVSAHYYDWTLWPYDHHDGC